ncbi:MAG: hypothetical protein ACE5JS_15490 [Nitrospinota bacterium]
MRSLVIASIFVALLSAPALAQEIPEMLDDAKKLYLEGEYRKAIRELKFAIGEIEAKLSGLFGEKMPPPPANYTAGEIEEQSMGALGGGQMIARKYTQKGGQGSIKAELLFNNPMVQQMLVLLNNPTLLRMQKGMKRVKIKGEEGILKWDKSRKSGDLSVILGGGQLMLKATGRKLGGPGELIKFMKSWDFDAAKKTAGLK